MTTKIQIDMNNEAFAEDPSAEVARILRTLANDIRRDSIGELIDIGPDGNGYKILRDINGNTVGDFSVES